MEGAYALKYKNLTTFSEQQLVDCSGDFGNLGCDGGWTFWAYNYLMNKNQTIETENQYPYTASTQQCNYTHGVASMLNYVNVSSGSEEDLVAKVNLAPVSICIDASSLSFQLYKSGVYVDSSCGNKMNELDHCVGLVGYNQTESGQQYYIVKNSWSTSWGDEGYIYMARNKSNMCGVATAASLVYMK